MGLFSKNASAEKTLKELMGGFIISNDFLHVLKRWGVKTEDGYKIQRYIKDDIKNQDLSSEEVPIKIHYYLKYFAGLNPDATPTTGDYTSTKNCFNCGNEFAADLNICPYCNNQSERVNAIQIKTPLNRIHENTKSCPSCGQVQEKENLFCISCGYSFKQGKTCPACKQSQDSDNKFCINCGYSFKQGKTCPACKQSQESDSRFCTNCGYDFTNKARQPSTRMRKFKFLANQEHNLTSCPHCNEDILKNAKYCHKCGGKISDLSSATAEAFGDDISELEALYKRSVSEKYSPNFKFAYVIFLDSYGQRFLKSTEREYKITENDLNTQAIKDGFLTQASPLASAQKMKMADLKEILKAHDIKVSGKKDELIERLGDNLSVEELEEIFPEKSYELSSEGQEFIDENDYVLFYEENYYLKRAFIPNEFEMIFKDKDYSSKEEMCSLIIEKLEAKKNMDIYDVESLIILYGAINDQIKLLDNYLKVFLFSINSGMNYADPDKMNALYSLLHSLSLDIDDLKNRFHEVYSNFSLLELKIPEKDSFTFLLKLFSGVNIYEIEDEVNRKFFAFD